MMKIYPNPDEQGSRINKVFEKFPVIRENAKAVVLATYNKYKNSISPCHGENGTCAALCAIDHFVLM